MSYGLCVKCNENDWQRFPACPCKPYTVKPVLLHTRYPHLEDYEATNEVFARTPRSAAEQFAKHVMKLSDGESVILEVFRNDEIFKFEISAKQKIEYQVRDLE